MGVTLKRNLALFLFALLVLSVAGAQTAPNLFVFEPGTPIRAADMNANFQLLGEQIVAALGLGDGAVDEVEALATAVAQLQAALEAGDLDGSSLEFSWDGTSLGVRVAGEGAYDYVDLRGPAGPQGVQGEPGAPGAPGAPGMDGVDGVDGVPGVDGKDGVDGAPGIDGKDGAAGRDGVDGAAGADGADGRGLEFAWSGTRLGVRFEGDAEYFYVDLQGPQGEQGLQGAAGPAGATGAAGADGANGVNGTDGKDGVNGTNGTDGRTLLNGSGSPAASVGAEDDFYIDTATWTIYGPKATGTWGAGTSLIGPKGSDGQGGGVGGVRIVETQHLQGVGSWNEVDAFAAECQQGEVLLDVTVNADVEMYVYGWLAGMVPVSATKTNVMMARNNAPYPFTIYATCLNSAG